jgi:hypothetical protein
MTNRSRVVEVLGEAVGIVVPEGEAYRFAAVKYSVWPLEGRLFDHPEDAWRAAARLSRDDPPGGNGVLNSGKSLEWTKPTLPVDY